MKITNEETAKVFDLYNENEKVVYTGTASEDLRYNGKTLRNSRILRENFAKDRDWKLRIIPLDKITDEHAIDILKIISAESNTITSNANYVRKWIAEYAKNSEVFQYLISKGYAVPLWFGIDHWANGMTAIELEIAFDATLIKAA